jgi:hypothetical protein
MFNLGMPTRSFNPEHPEPNLCCRYVFFTIIYNPLPLTFYHRPQYYYYYFLNLLNNNNATRDNHNEV